jgi:hypothetical protein
MANTKCYMCESNITWHVFKAYDESFCSTLCRTKLVRECDYTHECDLVKKHRQSNKPIQGEHRIGFDFSVIDIHYASHIYRQYIIDILCSITGLM